MDQRHRVVVLSRNYSTSLGVVRSLGTAGYAIDLVSSAHKKGISQIAEASRFVDHAVEVVCKKDAEGGRKVLAELLKYKGRYEEKPLLFVVDDFSASVMDEARDQLAQIFLMPNVGTDDPGSMLAYMDKALQAQFAKEAGIEVPLQWIIPLDEEDAIADDVVYPCFCKPLTSASGFKKEMMRCDTRGQLERHLASLRKVRSDRSVLVQEFLEIDGEIDLNGVCNDQEVNIPAIIRKTRVAQHEKGVTLAGRTCEVGELGDLAEKIRHMMQKYHYHGMFDMELNIAGDRILFNEVNLRSGGPSFVYFHSGANLPAVFAREMFGEPRVESDERVDATGKDLIYEKVAWEDYINGFISKKQLNELLSSADFGLVEYDPDPEPYKLFNQQIRQQAMRRKIKNTLKSSRNTVRTVEEVVGQTVKGYPQASLKNRRNPQADKPRVMVVGQNYCTNLCMARMLGEAGYEVEILRADKKKLKGDQLARRPYLALSSTYVKAYHHVAHRGHTGPIARKLLQLADADNPMVLMPADTLSARAIGYHYDELSECYLLPEMDGGPQRISAVVEPLLENAVLSKMAQGERSQHLICVPFLLQHNDCIAPGVLTAVGPKGIEERYFLGEDCDAPILPAYGIGIAGVLRSLHEIESECAPGLSAALQTVTDALAQQQMAGLFECAFLVEEGGGLRFGGLRACLSAGAYALSQVGANLPGMLADSLAFGKVPASPAWSDGVKVTYVNDKGLFELIRRGTVSINAYRSCLAEANISLVHDNRDEAPGKLFDELVSKTAGDEVVAGSGRYADKAPEGGADDAPRVLVVGSGYASLLAAARSYAQAGCTVDVLHLWRSEPDNLARAANPDLAQASNAVRAFYECVYGGTCAELMRKLVAVADLQRKTVLVVTDVATFTLIERGFRYLARWYHLPSTCANDGAYRKLPSCRQLKKVVNKALHPDAIEPCDPDRRDVADEAEDGWEQAVNEGVTSEELAEGDEWQEDDDQVSANADYDDAPVEGIDAQDWEEDEAVEDDRSCVRTYVAPVLCVRGRVVAPAIIASLSADEEQGEYRFGIGSSGTVWPLGSFTSLVRSAGEALAERGVQGPFALSFGELADGSLKLLSVRPYLPANSYALCKAGVNLPALWVRYLQTGELPEESLRYEGPVVSYANERYLAKVVQREASLADECAALTAAVDVRIIHDPDDVGPGELFDVKMIEAEKLRAQRALLKQGRSDALSAARDIKHFAQGYPQFRPGNARKAGAPKPRVLVTGRNYCSNLCIARAFGEAGYEVEVLRVHQSKPKRTRLLLHLRPAMYSTYVKAYYVCVSNHISQRIVNKMLAIAPPDEKMLVVPADDLMAGVIDEFYDVLSEHYILPGVEGQGGGVLRLMDKDVQKALAREAGLPVVNGCVIASHDGAFEIPETVSYPCFMKPNISKDAAKSRMRRCDTREELERAIEKYARRGDVEMLVEDFITVGREYSVLGVSTREGAIGPAFFVAEEGGSAEHRGVAGLGRMLSCDEQRELVDRVVAFVSSLGFDGLYDVDLIETPEGEMYFAEINMRFGASGYAFARCGLNLPAMYADYRCFGKPLDYDCKLPDEAVGTLFASEKVLLDEYAQGRLSRADHDAILQRADIRFVYNEDDPAPWEYYRSAYAIAATKRKVDPVRSEVKNLMR